MDIHGAYEYDHAWCGLPFSTNKFAFISHVVDQYKDLLLFEKKLIILNFSIQRILGVDWKLIKKEDEEETQQLFFRCTLLILYGKLNF